MTVTFVMDDMASEFSQPKMMLTSLAAVFFCTIVFVVVGIGGPFLFGEGVADDILENFAARSV